MYIALQYSIGLVFVKWRLLTDLVGCVNICKSFFSVTVHAKLGLPSFFLHVALVLTENTIFIYCKMAKNTQ